MWFIFMDFHISKIGKLNKKKNNGKLLLVKFFLMIISVNRVFQLQVF